MPVASINNLPGPLSGHKWQSIYIKNGQAVIAQKNCIIQFFRYIYNRAVQGIYCSSQQRKANKQTNKEFAEQFTAVYGHSFRFSDDDTINTDLMSGRKQLTPDLYDKTIRTHNDLMQKRRAEVKKQLRTLSPDKRSNPDEDTVNWIVHKMITHFNFNINSSALSLHHRDQIELLQFCHNQCKYDSNRMDEDEYIRQLSDWLLPKNHLMSIDKWIDSQFALKGLPNIFSPLMQTLSPEQPRKNMLEVLYNLCDTIARVTELNNRNCSTEARRQWQKDFILQQVIESQQAETILENLLSHRWTQQLITFSVILAAGQQGTGLENVTRTLKDILHACATVAGGDKPQQVKDWVDYYSQAKEDEEVKKAEYGSYLAFIDRAFYADLKKTCKKWTSTDLEKSIPLPETQLTVFNTDDADVRIMLRPRLYQRYKKAINLNEREQGTSLPFLIKADVSEENHYKNEQVTINHGLDNQLIMDLPRSTYIVNNEILTDDGDKQLARFKELIPDSAEQLLISCCAQQTLLNTAVDIFTLKTGLLPVGPNFGSVYYISNNEETKITLTVIHYRLLLNIGDENSGEPLAYLKLQTTLNLTELDGTVSYELTPAMSAA